MASAARPSDVPALHTSLAHRTGYLVSQVGQFAQKRFAERIATIGLTTRMWGALNVLDSEGAITQQQLGKLIGMDPSSIVGVIDGLQSRGLVVRRPKPNDRRAHALHLTDLGRQTLAQGRKLSREAQEELLAPLDADQRRQLHELLLRIAHGTHVVEEITTPPGPPAARD